MTTSSAGVRYRPPAGYKIAVRQGRSCAAAKRVSALCLLCFALTNEVAHSQVPDAAFTHFAALSGARARSQQCGNAVGERPESLPMIAQVPSVAGGSLGLITTGQQAHTPITVVFNGSALGADADPSRAAILAACRSLSSETAGQLLDADRAYRKQFERPLGVAGYPSREAGEAARWLRGWLASQVPKGTTLVLVGDETILPTWEVMIGTTRLNADSFYSDLDGDGVPETAVTRVLGTPDQIIRQLRGKQNYGSKAAILCSEDTRIHVETRAFAKYLSSSGYGVTLCGMRNDDAVTSSDVLIHFGHGSASGLFDRFGNRFLDVASLPDFAHALIVFADGCGTLPPGSPLLRAFLDHGALAYCGSAESVQGMIPARFANELVEHFVEILAQRPELTLPQVLVAARAAYVRSHPGLEKRLREAAAKGTLSVAGDEEPDLLTVAEWVHYGDPRAVLPVVGTARPLTRLAAALSQPLSLTPANPLWKTTFAAQRGDGEAVLAICTEVPLVERARYRFTVLQDGQEIAQLDSRGETRYQRLGTDCRGGYVCGQTYRARYLVPLRPGGGELEVRLSEGASALLMPGTEIDVWRPNFEDWMHLRPGPGSSHRKR